MEQARGSSFLFSNQMRHILRELHTASSPTGSRFGPQIKGLGKHREMHFPHNPFPSRLKGEIAPVKSLCSELRGQDCKGERTPMNLQLVSKALGSTEKCCLHGVLSCCVASLYLYLSYLKAFRALLQSIVNKTF